MRFARGLFHFFRVFKFTSVGRLRIVFCVTLSISPIACKRVRVSGKVFSFKGRVWGFENNRLCSTVNMFLMFPFSVPRSYQFNFRNILVSPTAWRVIIVGRRMAKNLTLTSWGNNVSIEAVLIVVRRAFGVTVKGSVCIIRRMTFFPRGSWNFFSCLIRVFRCRFVQNFTFLNGRVLEVMWWVMYFFRATTNVGRTIYFIQSLCISSGILIDFRGDGGLVKGIICVSRCFVGSYYFRLWSSILWRNFSACHCWDFKANIYCEFGSTT